MRRWLGLGAGLVVLAGVAAWLVFEATPETHAPASKAPRAEDPRTTALFQRLLQASPLAPSEEGRLTIRGTVLGPQGPVSGARVLASTTVQGEALSAMPCKGSLERTLLQCVREKQVEREVEQLVAERRGEALIRAEAVTAADGSFTLTGMDPGEYTLWAESEEGIGLRYGVAAGSEPVKLRLGIGVRLSGVVSDDTEALVEGALVTVIYAPHSRFFEVLTDARGRFEIGPLPPGQIVAVVAKRGLLTSTSSFVLHRSTVEWNFELSRPRRITGQVLLAKAPAAGVAVYLREALSDTPSQELRTTTDGKGRFSFEELAPQGYELVAWHGDRGASVEIRLEKEAESQDVTLELEPATFIQGTVSDEAHQPISGAWVELFWEGEEPAQPPRMTMTYTDGEGRYRLGPSTPGPYFIRVSADGYEEQQTEVQELKVGEVSWDFVMKQKLRIEGVVVDASSLPVSDVQINLTTGVDAERGGRGFAFTRSDGRFSFTVSEPGSYQLSMDGRSILHKELGVTAPTEPLRIVVEKQSSVSGEVLDEEGVPLEDVVVTLAAESEAHQDERLDGTSTDSLGRFTLYAPSSGRYVAQAVLYWGDTLRTTSQLVELSEPTEHVQLRLGTGNRLSGVVEDWLGRPVPEVLVQLQPVQESAPRNLCRDKRVGTMTDAEGRFTFPQVLGEHFELCIKKGDYTLLPATPGELRLVPVKNDGQEIRIVVGREVFLTGRLIHPDGSPVTRYTINGREVQREDGEISIAIHAPGVEQLEISAPGLQTVRPITPTFRDGEVMQDLGSIVLSP